MITRREKTWHFGSTAATLLAAYLLVLQGLAGGLAGASPFGGAGLFGSAICFNKAQTPLDRSTPVRPSRHSDVCCVFHCSSFGGGTAGSPFWDETPLRVVKTQARLLSNETGVRLLQATLPVGSRAPPAHDPVTAA